MDFFTIDIVRILMCILLLFRFIMTTSSRIVRKEEFARMEPSDVTVLRPSVFDRILVHFFCLLLRLSLQRPVETG